MRATVATQTDACELREIKQLTGEIGGLKAQLGALKESIMRVAEDRELDHVDVVATVDKVEANLVARLAWARMQYENKLQAQRSAFESRLANEAVQLAQEGKHKQSRVSELEALLDSQRRAFEADMRKQNVALAAKQRECQSLEKTNAQLESRLKIVLYRLEAANKLKDTHVETGEAPPVELRRKSSEHDDANSHKLRRTAQDMEDTLKVQNSVLENYLTVEMSDRQHKKKTSQYEEALQSDPDGLWYKLDGMNKNVQRGRESSNAVVGRQETSDGTRPLKVDTTHDSLGDGSEEESGVEANFTRRRRPRPPPPPLKPPCSDTVVSAAQRFQMHRSESNAGSSASSSRTLETPHQVKDLLPKLSVNIANTASRKDTMNTSGHGGAKGSQTERFGPRYFTCGQKLYPPTNSCLVGGFYS